MTNIFAWIYVVLAALMILPFLVRWLNKRFIKSEALGKQLNKYGFLHKVFGVLLVVTILINAIFVFDSWCLHAGTILVLWTVFTSLAAASFYIFKKKWLFVLHRVTAILLILMLLCQLIFPTPFCELLRLL